MRAGGDLNFDRDPLMPILNEDAVDLVLTFWSRRECESVDGGIR